MKKMISNYLIYFIVITVMLSAMIATNVVIDEESDTVNNTVSNIKNATSTMPDEIREVLEPIVIEQANKYTILNESFVVYKELVLAIIMQESSGDYVTYPDVMQSSESKGLAPNTFKTPQESIEQGVYYLHSIFQTGIDLGLTDSNTHIKIYIQSYNFGIGFLSHYIGLMDNNTIEEIVQHFSDSKGENYGDINYIENVLRFLNYTELTGDFYKPLNNNNVMTERFGIVENPTSFGSRNHKGIDLSCYAGEPIYASQGGVVELAMYNGAYGNYVLIKHSNDTKTAYAHLIDYNTSQNENVQQGDVIGYCGSTGWSTGNHLHYEIQIGGIFIDPEPYFDYTRYHTVTPDDYVG